MAMDDGCPSDRVGGEPGQDPVKTCFGPMDNAKRINSLNLSGWLQKVIHQKQKQVKLVEKGQRGTEITRG